MAEATSYATTLMPVAVHGAGPPDSRGSPVKVKVPGNDWLLRLKAELQKFRTVLPTAALAAS